MQKNTRKKLEKWANRQNEMRMMKKYGINTSYKDIGDFFGISKQRAYQIVNGKTINPVNAKRLEELKKQ